MDSDEKGRLIDLVGTVFECIEFHEERNSHEQAYIGFAEREPFLLLINSKLKRLEFEPTVTSDHLMMTTMRDLKLRLEARFSRSEFSRYQISYFPTSRDWRLDWDERNVETFDACLREHVQDHHLGEDVIYPLKSQRFVLEELSPNSYETLRMAGLFLSSKNEEDLGLSLFHDLLLPPEKFQPILGKLGRECPFPFFDADLLNLIQAIYRVDRAVAVWGMEDLRLGNSLRYLPRILDDPELDMTPLKLIDELRSRVAPIAPFDRLARTLCYRLEFKLAG